MKTFLRFIFGFLILIALVIGIAFTSPVQTAAVNFAGKKFVGEDFRVDKVSVGLSSAEITGLVLKKDGMHVTVPNFLIEARFLGVISSNEIVIEKILAKDISVDVSKMTQSQEQKADDAKKESDKPTPTEIQEFFKAFQTPKVRIKEMNINGHVSLPENKSASFEVLSDKNNTTEGVALNFNLVYSDTTAEAPLGNAQIKGTLVALQNENNLWHSISHDGSIILKAGTLLKQQNTLNTSAKIAYANDVLNEISCSVASEKSTHPILNITGKPTDKIIHVAALFILQSTELAQWMDDSMLPFFDLNGQADANVDLSTFDITANTNGNITAADFSKINPLLASIAQIQAEWKSDFSFQTNQQIFHLETLHFQLNESKTSARITASTEQKISLNLKNVTQPVFSNNGDVAKVKASNITPALLASMLPPLVTWENIDADLTVVSKDENIFATAGANVRKFLAKENEKALTNPLNIQASASIESDSSEIRVKPLKISIAESATNIALANASVEAYVAMENFAWKSVKLDSQANLTGITKQPVLSELLKIVNGKINLAAEASNQGSINITYSVKGEDISSVNKSIRLISLNGNGSMDKENAIKLDLTAGLETGTHKSDVIAKADFQMLPDAWKASATINSNEIFVDDFITLKDILLKEQSAQANVPSQPTPQETEQSTEGIPLFMKGDGGINVSLSKIHYQALDIADTKLRVKFAHGSIDLEECKTLVDKMNVQANGSLKLKSENNQNSYALDSKVDIKDIDPTVLMQKFANSDALKMLNAQFNADGAFTSQADNLGELAKNIQGHFDVSSKNGIIHPFQTSNIIERTSGVIDILGKVREAAGREKSLAEDVYDYFKEIKYDQLSLKLKRDGSMDISIPEVLLKQADLAFQGSGNIAYNAASFMDSKLSGNLKLDAKGTPGKLLEQIGLIKSDATETESTLLSGPSFTIGGSLKDPDFSNFSKVLSDAIAASAKAKANEKTGNESSNTTPTKEETRKANIEKGLNALENILNRKKE